MLIVVLTSLQLLNIHNINSNSKDKNLRQGVTKADITKTSQTRHVTKFKSRKKGLANKNQFQNLQNKNQAANSSVFLSNKASFKYQVGYSNYNIYGAKISNFHVTVAKNTTHQAINIGTNLILAITVKVSAPGQKWANLSITRTFTPTKDMIPTSIHYLILGSKNINDANISLNIVYEMRTDPMEPKTVKIGYFNVNNIDANVGAVLSDPVIGGMTIGIMFAVLIIETFAIHRLYLWWEQWEEAKATACIRAIIKASQDELEMANIELGSSEYANGKSFPKNFKNFNLKKFKAKTSTMMKRANRKAIFGDEYGQEPADENYVKNYQEARQANIDKMTVAIDEISAARARGAAVRAASMLRAQQLVEDVSQDSYSSWTGESDSSSDSSSGLRSSSEAGRENSIEGENGPDCDMGSTLSINDPIVSSEKVIWQDTKRFTEEHGQQPLAWQKEEEENQRVGDNEELAEQQDGQQDGQQGAREQVGLDQEKLAESQSKAGTLEEVKGVKVQQEEGNDLRVETEKAIGPALLEGEVVNNEEEQVVGASLRQDIPNHGILNNDEEQTAGGDSLMCMLNRGAIDNSDEELSASLNLAVAQYSDFENARTISEAGSEDSISIKSLLSATYSKTQSFDEYPNYILDANDLFTNRYIMFDANDLYTNK